MALHIDLYTDIACPWCLIGEIRLDRVLARMFPDLEVDLEHHPVLLMPDLPVSGVPMADYLRQKYNMDDPAQAWAAAEAAARSAGIAFDHRVVTMAYPTLKAHTLIRHARERGTQHQLARRLTDAYLLRGENIASTTLLADIATGFAFDHDEVLRLVDSRAELDATLAAVARGAAQGIRTVPHMIVEGQAMVGNRTEDEIAALIAAVRRAA
jgi:predicted DsbA family dithiol-disulfide isomerase